MSEPKLTVHKATAWIRVPLDEDGWPLSHGERMVEVEPGAFMDREWYDLMIHVGIDPVTWEDVHPGDG